MRKTPDSVSKERQRIGQEIATWEAGISDSRRSLQLDFASRASASQKVAFCEEQLKECRKRLRALRGKYKKRFWSFNN